MRNGRTAACLALIVLSTVCFLRCWDYGLINLDDYSYLTVRPYVSTWQGWSSVRDFLTNTGDGVWMPLTWFSYAFDFLVFGNWFGGFHLHSVAIHCLNACLVWHFLRLVFRERKDLGGLCLVGALVWAVHPLRCESVVFLASRKDVLSFFWEILALICWVRGGTRNTVLSSAFFVAGSLCKPSVMTFPVLCLLVDAFVIRRVRMLRYVFPVAYMLFLGGLASWLQASGGATVQFAQEPLWGRLLGACAGFGIYLRNFVWPQWLAPQCLNVWPKLPRFLLPGLVISAVYGLCLFRKALVYWESRRELVAVERLDGIPVAFESKAPADLPFVGAAWFAIAVAPMLGISNFGYHAFADRFTYIPAVGLSILVVIALGWAAKRVGKTPVLVLSSVAVLSLMGATWWQTGFWENDYRLFSRTLEVDGDSNAFAHSNLGYYHFECHHDLTNAVAEYEAAMEIDISYVINGFPIYMIALGELGRDDELSRRLDTFVEAFERRFGRDRAMQILSNATLTDREDRYFRFIYRASKFALWLTDRDSFGAIEEFLAEEKCDEFEEDPVWLYLRWKFYRLKGDRPEADRLFRKLTDPKSGREFMRFRFLSQKEPCPEFDPKKGR